MMLHTTISLDELETRLTAEIERVRSDARSHGPGATYYETIAALADLLARLSEPLIEAAMASDPTAKDWYRAERERLGIEIQSQPTQPGGEDAPRR